jgi:hypothetical protein
MKMNVNAARPDFLPDDTNMGRSDYQNASSQCRRFVANARIFFFHNRNGESHSDHSMGAFTSQPRTNAGGT